MDLKTVFPVVTLLLGWFLKELESRFGAGRNLKRAINRAISELLDIHQMLAQHQNAVQRLRSESRLPLDSEVKVRQALGRLLSGSAHAMDNYNSAIIDVASENPIAGTELRALARELDQLISMITQLVQHPDPTEDLVRLIDIGIEEGRANVRGCALMLAKRRGLRVTAAVRRHIQKHVGCGDGPQKLQP